MKKISFSISKIKNKVPLKKDFLIFQKIGKYTIILLFGFLGLILIIRYIYIFISNLQSVGLENYLNPKSSDNVEGRNFDEIHISLPFTSSYLVAGGDVMLSRNIGYFAKQEGYDRIFKTGNYNPLSQFPNCTEKNCLLFLNLESLFCEPDNDIQMGGFDFRSNPQNIQTLLQYKGDKNLLLSLPNNHFSNGGFQGLTITKNLLNQYNIGYVGAGFTKEESREIFSWENNGIKLCFGAYSYDGGITTARGGTAYRNRINELDIKSDLQKMQDSKCDVKIISLHRGAEYRFSPNYQQKKLAHSLVDSGADLILGGHSHIPGEFEKYKDKYIFYSLGNFIFDQGWGKTATESQFDYFYDADLGSNTVPTYISMLINLKFTKNLLNKIDIELENINFNSTTNGIFQPVSEEVKGIILKKIIRNN